MEQTLPLPVAIVLYAIGGVSLMVGLGVLWRVARGQTLVPYEPRRPVPWNAGHIVLVLAYLLLPLALDLLNNVARLLGLTDGGVDSLTAGELIGMLLFMSVAGLLVTGATAAVCRILAGATWSDLGLRSDTVLADIRLGGVTFLALAAPLYLLQWWLTRQFPSEHPVIELLTSRRDPGILVLCGISTVIVAPITEEAMFRLFLQGWLESVSVARRASSPAATEADQEEAVSERVAANAPPRDMDGNPYLSPQSAPQPPDCDTTRPQMPIVALPILASSFLFAALHQWPDQVPLFVLALALGYLYQRTHRILPCIVLHACLNLTSLALFLIGQSF